MEFLCEDKIRDLGSQIHPFCPSVFIPGGSQFPHFSENRCSQLRASVAAGSRFLFIISVKWVIFFLVFLWRSGSGDASDGDGGTYDDPTITLEEGTSSGGTSNQKELPLRATLLPHLICQALLPEGLAREV